MRYRQLTTPSHRLSRFVLTNGFFHHSYSTSPVNVVGEIRGIGNYGSVTILVCDCDDERELSNHQRLRGWASLRRYGTEGAVTMTLEEYSSSSLCRKTSR